jgi:CHAD domain-containing protein
MPASSNLDHILAAMKVQVDAIHAHEAGARTGRDPEDVHQMRVAVRRLRAILRASRSLFDPKWVDDLRRELKWLGTALGRVRDLDVLHAYLRFQLKALPAPERREAQQHLLRHLDADRVRARAALRAALASPRYARLLTRLKVALVHPPARTSAVSLLGIAATEFKKLKKAMKALPKQPSADELHAVRIKVKRARYAAEVVQAVIGRRVDQFNDKAEKLQDILGEHQDAVVTEAYLRKVTARNRAAQALAQRLIKQQRKRRKKALAAFREIWRKLKRRGRKAFGKVPTTS